MRLFGKKNRLDRYAWMFNGANYLQRTNPSGLDLNGAEMITNSNSRDFETNEGGWAGLGTTTITRSTADFHSGVASGLVVQTGAGLITNGIGLNTALPTIGLNYTVRFFVKSISGDVNLRFVYGAGGQTPIYTITTEWTEIILNRFASGIQYLRIYCTGGTASYYIDDISIKPAYDAIINIPFSNNRNAVQPILSLRDSASDRLKIFLDGMPLKATVSNGTISATALNGITPSQKIFIIGDSKSNDDSWIDALLNSSYDYSEATPRCATGGRTVATTQAAIDAHLATVTGVPTHILFNLGANDVGSLPARATWVGNCSYIVNACHTKWPDAQILFVTVWRQGFNAECDTLASYIADVLALYPSFTGYGHDERVWLKGSDDGATMTTDGTHYSTAGQTEANLQWRSILPSSVWDNRMHLASILIRKSGNVEVWLDGVQGTGVSVAALGLVLFDELLIGVNGSDYYADKIGGFNIIKFSAVSTTVAASIIADAYNRFRQKKAFAKNYPGGTIILDQDPKNNGCDTSAYGNHLTPVGTPPPGIIRI